MSFFQQQDNARKSTKALVLLFCVAVFLIIAITNLAIAMIIWSFDAGIFQQQSAYMQSLNDLQAHPEMVDNFLEYLKPERIALISLVVVGVIAAVILFKRAKLSGGGKVVAESLGGSKILMDTKNPQEKKILNVVEEMAIASGVPVPPVYILEEPSVNAFAAGYNVNDAVIGISRGSIEHLDRDQLQGVVAHEFSHILNGDMRLNINLIAVLAGILFIGHAGWFLVRMSGGRRYSSNRNSNSGFVVAGIVLVLVGFVGTFFGSLIKAAVSRQREYLADASAVQFTRNPQGIADALKVIGGSVFGSRISAPNTDEVSHLFFDNALSNKVSSLFATHPPLNDRIKRIEPNWNGKYIVPKNAAEGEAKNEAGSGTQTPSREDVALGVIAGATAVGASAAIQNLQSSVDTVGQPNESSYAHAERVMRDIDGTLKNATSKPISSRALVYLLLLDDNKQSKKKQWDYLQAEESFELSQMMVKLNKPMNLLPKGDRLDLIELTIPALKEMTETEYEAFIKHIVFLVKADDKIELFEWLIHSLLLYYLKPQYGKVETKPAKYRNLKVLRNECRFILSHLTYAGREADYDSLNRVFKQGFSDLDLGTTELLPREKLNLQDLNNSLFHFARLFPLVKPKLLKACAECIQADQHISIDQYELLRAVSALIECPMPSMELAV